MSRTALSESDRAKIVDWARRHPVIRRVHLFGSRARGDHRPDSDIDLGIEVDREPGDTDALTTWINWKAEFEESPDLRLSAPVDLQWYDKDAGLVRVGPGVERDGVLLYERAAISSANEW